METLLIGPDDFLPYRAIAANIDVAKRLAPHIVEAQRLDLMGLLGTHLYYDLLSNTAAYKAALIAYVSTYVPTEDNPQPTPEFLAGFEPTRDQQYFYELLNGVSYDAMINNINIVKVLPGLKPVLVYFAYKRFVNRDNIRSTPTGFAQKITIESQPVSAKQLSEEANRAEADARAFYVSCEEYMRDKAPYFEKYRQGCGQQANGGNEGRLTAPRNRNVVSRGFNRIETDRRRRRY